MELISHNKSKKNDYKNKSSKHEESQKKLVNLSESDDLDIEVTGTDATSAPLITSADSELDPDIIDMLYTKPRNIPLRGENASSWDSDY